MNLSKKKATLLNMIFSAVYQLTTALFGFILPNILLNAYGAELHGYTSTVSSIMSYIAIINAGLAPAAIQAMYGPLANKDNKRISEVLNAIDRFYVRSGCLYTIAVIVASLVLPFVIGDQIPRSYVVLLMLVIGATNTLDCFVYSKYRVLMQADQKLFVISIVDTFFYLIRIAAQIIMIKCGLSIVVVMGAPAVMVILRTCALSVICKKEYPGLDRKIKPDTKALSKRWSAMFHQLAGVVVYNTDVTLLTLFRSLVEVSIYSVYNLVFSHMYNLLTNIFSKGTVASFGRIMQEKDKKKLCENYDIYEFGYYFVISFVYGVAASMILPFVSVYTRKYTDIAYFDVKLAFLFMVIGIANNMRVPSGTMIDAAGHFKETQWRAALEALINIVVSLLLVKPLGMYGLLIGTVCSFAYRTTDIIYYAHKHILEIPCSKSILRILRTVCIVIVSVLLYRFLVGKYVLGSWIEWVGYAVITSLVTIVVVLIGHILTEPLMLKKTLITLLGSKILRTGKR